MTPTPNVEEPRTSRRGTTTGPIYHEDGIYCWTNGTGARQYVGGGMYVYSDRWSGTNGTDTGHSYVEYSSGGVACATENSLIYYFNNVSSGLGENGHPIISDGIELAANNTTMGTNSSEAPASGTTNGFRTTAGASRTKR